MEIKGALYNFTDIRPLKLRCLPHVKGTKISKLPTVKVVTVGPREIERHHFWKHEKGMGVSL